MSLQPRRPIVAWGALKECGQQGEGGGPSSPLLCPGEAASGVLCPVLSSSVQERQETCRESAAEGHKDYEGHGTSPL